MKTFQKISNGRTLNIIINDDELYIGSISPTIDVRQQRELLKVTKDIMPMLTVAEWMEIMNVYDKAINRIFKENGVKENDTKKCE